MEAIVIFFVLFIYIWVRVKLGHHETTDMIEKKMYKKGIDLIEAKQYQKAKEFFDIKIKENPTSAVTYMCRASCHYGLGNVYQSIFDAEKSITFQNTLPENYLLLGSAYFGLKDYQMAVEEYEKAVWFSREQNIEALKFRGLCYYYLGNFEKAKYSFQRALKKGDEESNFYLLKIERNEKFVI
ncbi:MAG: tetratricopeptide repeat protein [Bacteroidetes bacterium]|nr:MAG: tetratricopeptide repeat protein [Bacteroidota bacterium]TAG87404.1 MAG: tetratricopeptide repeat protein [Bacteroidota bacterium]